MAARTFNKYPRETHLVASARRQHIKQLARQNIANNCPNALELPCCHPSPWIHPIEARLRAKSSVAM